MSSLIKSQLVHLLKELVQDGYQIEATVSGIELRGLELKPDVFVSTSLPVFLASGFVELISISIPLRYLGSKPVEVQVKNVMLLLKPKSSLMWSADNELDGFSQEKARAAAWEWGEHPIKSKLEEFFKLYSDEGSYKSQIFKRILHNLSICINNVHVRYEDHYNPVAADVCHSIGIRMGQMSSYTTDAFWQPAYEDKTTGSIWKIVEVGDIGVYCDGDTESIIHTSELDHGKYSLVPGAEILKRLTRMEAHIAQLSSRTYQWWDTTSRKAHHYVVSPVSQVTLRIISTILEASHFGSRGSISTSMLCDPVAVAVDTTQVIVLSRTLELMTSYTTWQQKIRKDRYDFLLRSLPDSAIDEFTTLIHKKVKKASSLTPFEVQRLWELQQSFPLYRLFSIKQRCSHSSPEKLSKRQSSNIDPVAKVVSVTFEDGSLGLDLEVNLQKYGHRGLTVNSCVSGGQAAALGTIHPGYILIEIGDVNVEAMAYEDILDLLTSASRPLNVTFRTLAREVHRMNQNRGDESMGVQVVSFSASIESYSFSLVSANIRREVIRVIGTEFESSLAVRLTYMGVIDSIIGSMSTNNLQMIDRWNPTPSFASQRILALDSFETASKALEFSFEVPLVSRNFFYDGQKVCEEQGDSQARVKMNIGTLDVSIVVQHLNALLWLVDDQVGVLIDARKKMSENGSSGHFVLSPEMSPKKMPGTMDRELIHADFELGMELLPSALANALNGVMVLPATYGTAKPSNHLWRWHTRMFTLRLLNKEACERQDFLLAGCFRESTFQTRRLDEFASSQSMEYTLAAFSIWTSENTVPIFLGGYFNGEDQGRGFLDVITSFQSLVFSSQSSKQLHLHVNAVEKEHNEETIEIHAELSLKNTEVHIEKLGNTAWAVLDLLSPLSIYVSSIPITWQSGKSVDVKGFTAQMSSVCLILDTQKDSLEERVFGMQVHGSFNYKSSEDGLEEVSVLEVGPLYTGLVTLQNVSNHPIGRVQLVCHQSPSEEERDIMTNATTTSMTNNRKRFFSFKVAETVQETMEGTSPSPSGQVQMNDSSANFIQPLYYNSHAQWKCLPSSSLRYLLEQVAENLTHLWPYSSEVDEPESLQTSLKILVQSMVKRFLKEPSSLSFVEYERKNATTRFFPSLVSDSSAMRLASSRKDFKTCTLVEDASRRLHWNAQEIESTFNENSRLEQVHLVNTSLVSCILFQAPHLMECRFTRCTVSNENVETILSVCTKLTQLHFAHVGSISHFKWKTQSLQHVSMIECTSLHDRVVEELVNGSTHLESLDLSGCIQLHDFELKSTSLRTLNLSHCRRLVDECITKLCMHCTQLSTLDLTWCYQLKQPKIQGRLLTNLSIYRCIHLSNEAINIIFEMNPLLLALDMSGARRDLTRRKTLVYPTQEDDLVHRFIRFIRKQSRLAPMLDLKLASTSLRSISFEDCTVLTDQELHHCCLACPRLESLNAGYCRALKKVQVIGKALKRLSFAFCVNLQTSAVQMALVNCVNLEYVNLQGCQSVTLDSLDIPSRIHAKTMGCNSLHKTHGKFAEGQEALETNPFIQVIP